MREWIYGRNPVNEVLRAGRRQVFRLLVMEGAQSKGLLANILDHCNKNNIPVESAPALNSNAVNRVTRVFSWKSALSRMSP